MSSMPLPKPRFKRRYALVLLAALGLLAAYGLNLHWKGLLPRGEGFVLWKRFFYAALRPAIDYESAAVPAGSPPFLWVVLKSVLRTVEFAVASMALALIGGLGLGILSSHSFWDSTIGQGSRGRKLRNRLRILFRTIAAMLRSVHELLWAILFLAAIGQNSSAALLALTLPFTGILAKLFSEIMDEAPNEPSAALEGLGCHPGMALFVGRLPIAWPDMAAYAFYRFECAIRSSAVLGFFGFQTMGYHLELSYNSLHYREVWTLLYALLFMVWALERWSGILRRSAVQ
ncbi:MAG: phosphonate transport system permease protein [Planctomycetota bacterium]|jgi:phosphonate transport system permease protein